MAYQDDHGPPMFTYAMLAVFIAFFAAQFQNFDLTRFYAFPWRIAHGEAWRLITSTFLHGSILHILFNVALFFRFSRVIDNWMGPWGALALYVMFAASSSAAQLLVSPTLGGSIGASGAVYGLFGFLWVMRRRRDDAAEAANQNVVQTMLAWLAVCFVLNMFGGNIANTAHAWGLLLGWLLGQTLVARQQHRVLMIIATMLVFALPLGLTQKVVWDRTLGLLPIARYEYTWRLPPEAWESWEHEIQRWRPGMF